MEGSFRWQQGTISRREAFRIATVAVAGLSRGLPGLAAERTGPASLDSLRVIVFPGGFNLPIWAAQEKGLFARHGVEVELSFTPGSVHQITRLSAGEFDIAHTAMDNVVAYVEGQGEEPMQPPPDLVAFMGGDNGFLHLVVQPDVATYDGLRGRRLSVDAVTTGYAFVLRRMLEAHGLREGDYELVPAGGVLQRWEALRRGEHAGTLLVTPFELIARRTGLRVLESAIAVLGRYQGVVGATRRQWAQAHTSKLVGYIRGYVAGLTWLYDPTHRREAIDLLVRRANMDPGVAGEAYRVLIDPVSGFSPSATLDVEGVRTVLALRTSYGKPSKILDDPARYFDLRYHSRAMGV